MPFTPKRLLIAYDDSRGHCARVVPEMRQMLEYRAFLVDVHEIGSGEPSLSDYDGLVLGTPVLGLAIRGVGPSPAVREFIEAHSDLEGMRVAIFCVYESRPGNTFDRMKNLLLDKGAEIVAEQAFHFMRPKKNSHVIPAECMVRIR